MRWSTLGALIGALPGLLLGGCSAVGVVNALAPRDTWHMLSDQDYGTKDQRLDVYLPTTACTKPRAIVVFFYGGSWKSGSRSDYLFVGEALASRGYVVVIPDYRTYPQVRFPEFADDAAEAVHWARHHAAGLGADPGALYLMGHSAGAQIAALLATDARYLARQGMAKTALAGVVGLSGPYDFLPLVDPVLKEVFPEPLREASQPIHLVQGDEPPMLLLSGQRDALVDPGNTSRFAAVLRARGDTVQVRYYERPSHAMMVGALAAPLRRLAPVLDDVDAFMRRTSQERRSSSRLMSADVRPMLQPTC
ncbi:carboxylesterase (plasmid) [Cupriavidus sp. USMAHM13]|uniref:alpha/beta hydrolase n=1 Tax=Cupriavidus sp. USMAHM13 TaxID=1389192 RepID=UPI0008A68161|nr:alpha/beta hydrolase [Cupriavidus sp. USMAHM13]AOZ04328.1 carboxylesterase [Cupriavidus sp. USMAHM13]